MSRHSSSPPRRRGEAGIHITLKIWIPASAGMTDATNGDECDEGWRVRRAGVDRRGVAGVIGKDS
ncbi:hypothetical protein [Nitrosomonas ureae]|uniref:hypothetical protein n=1 Tax=Nitrosomonas ureae TaxID=44577 RepID=UPI0011B200B7|nr:hypothetical protein [Nitrosomonas ureae]